MKIFILMIFLLSNVMAYNGFNGKILYKLDRLSSITDSNSVNLYNQFDFFSDISHAVSNTFISTSYKSNFLKLDSYEMSDLYLPNFSYVLHKEFADLVFSYSRDLEKIDNDTVLSKDAVNNFKFLFSIGNPDYRFAFLFDGVYGSGDFVGENNENYKRSIIGSADLGLAMAITPNPNLSFNLEILERAAGDSISKEKNGQIITDGSIALNAIPDINFGFQFINENVNQMAFFKWSQNNKIANSNFYNSTSGGYLKIKFGMPKEYNSKKEFGYLGLFNIAKISKKDFLPITASIFSDYSFNAVELYQPTDDNNFPTQQGEIKENFGYKMSTIKNGIGLKYCHNLFDFILNGGYTPVSLEFEDNYKNRGTFDNKIVTKSGDADGYKLPSNEIFKNGFENLDVNEHKFSVSANFKIYKFLKSKVFKPSFLIGYRNEKLYLSSSFYNGNFLNYNKPVNFENRELNLGLVYPTYSRDLNYIPLGGYNDVSEKMFISPLKVSSFMFNLNSIISDVMELNILYSLNSFDFSDIKDKKFKGNDLLLEFKYLF